MGIKGVAWLESGVVAWPSWTVSLDCHRDEQSEASAVLTNQRRDRDTSLQLQISVLVHQLEAN